MFDPGTARDLQRCRQARKPVRLRVQIDGLSVFPARQRPDVPSWPALQSIPLLSGGVGRVVREVETEVLDVVHGFVEEHRDVVVVEAVHHGAAGSGAGHQPEGP